MSEYNISEHAQALLTAACTVQDFAKLEAYIAHLEAGQAPDNARSLVLSMRDCFLTLVAAYNAVGAYQDAQDAQAMAIALHQYEDKHRLTDLTWPLEVITDDYGRGLRTIDGKIAYGEEL